MRRGRRIELLLGLLVLMVEGVVDVEIRLLLLLLPHQNASDHSDISRPLPSVAAAHAAAQHQRDRNHKDDGKYDAEDALGEASAVVVIVLVVVILAEAARLLRVFSISARVRVDLLARAAGVKLHNHAALQLLVRKVAFFLVLGTVHAQVLAQPAAETESAALTMVVAVMTVLPMPVLVFVIVRLLRLRAVSSLRHFSVCCHVAGGDGGHTQADPEGARLADGAVVHEEGRQKGHVHAAGKQRVLVVERGRHSADDDDAGAAFEGGLHAGGDGARLLQMLQLV